MSDFTIKPVGDCALCAEFAEEISIAVNSRVHALDALVRKTAIPGVVETVPTYRTLIIHYRPEVISWEALRERVLALHAGSGAVVETAGTVVELPVLYGGKVALEPGAPHYDGWDGRETAPDLGDVLAHEGISREELIRRHSANDCYVYFQAFAIGHSYVGGPEKSLTVPRRKTPRTLVPQGSVAVWADQTVLYGFDLPCGWQVIGRTPVLLYDERRAQPSYCFSGQWIRFVPIGAGEYARIRALALAGRYEPVIRKKEAGA